MISGIRLLYSCVVLVVFLCGNIASALSDGVDGAFVSSSKVGNGVKETPKIAPYTSPVTAIVLPALPSTAKRATMHNKNTAQQIGVERDLPMPYAKGLSSIPLKWQNTNDGGMAALLKINDVGAASMRLGLDIIRIHPGTQFRFYGAGYPAHVYGPYPQTGEDITHQALGGLFWSPVVTGSTIFMEIYLPAGLTVKQAPVIQTIKTSHIWGTAKRGFKNLIDVGASGTCNIDVACQPTWSNISQAEGKVVFQSAGGSFLCSGTLLNDKDITTLTPYFLTARHCISTAAEAASVTVYWNFQKSICGGAAPTTVTQQNGAMLLHTSTAEDMTLLQLNNALPNGVFLAGWTSNSAPLNTNVTGIHHPSGDLKKNKPRCDSRNLLHGEFPWWWSIYQLC